MTDLQPRSHLFPEEAPGGRTRNTASITVTATSCLIAVVATALVATASAQDAERIWPERWHLAPLPPGQGGTLLIAAPKELCADATRELQLRQFYPMDGMLYAVREPAGPSACEWQFDGLRPGPYDVVIKVKKDGRTLARALGEVFAGGTSFIRLDLARIELVGLVTVNGIPTNQGVRLMFNHSDPSRIEWPAPIDVNGRYRVTVEKQGREMICARLTRLERFNTFSKCQDFPPGFHRLDLEVPPGLIRIEIPPVVGADPQLRAQVTVRGKGAAGNGFYVAKGFRGDYFGNGYRKYEISVETIDGGGVLNSSTITLSPDQPVADVHLPIALAR